MEEKFDFMSCEDEKESLQDSVNKLNLILAKYDHLESFLSDKEEECENLEDEDECVFDDMFVINSTGEDLDMLKNRVFAGVHNIGIVLSKNKFSMSDLDISGLYAVDQSDAVDIFMENIEIDNIKQDENGNSIAFVGSQCFYDLDDAQDRFDQLLDAIKDNLDEEAFDELMSELDGLKVEIND